MYCALHPSDIHPITGRCISRSLSPILSILLPPSLLTTINLFSVFIGLVLNLFVYSFICLLDSMCELNHIVFVFLHRTISLRIMPFRSSMLSQTAKQNEQTKTHPFSWPGNIHVVKNTHLLKDKHQIEYKFSLFPYKFSFPSAFAFVPRGNHCCYL